MKITLKSIGKLAIVAAISIASSVPAHAWEYSDFIVLSGPYLNQIAYAPADPTNVPDYSTHPYWAGEYAFNMGIVVFGMQVPADYVLPSDLQCLMTVKDAYGNYVLNKDRSEDAKKELDDPLNIEYDQHLLVNHFSIPLGGHYEFRAFMNFMNWDKTFTQEIYDPASVRIYGNSEPKPGENADFNVYFNTGYPYDIASFSGNENVNYRFEYTAPKSDESVQLASGNVPLNFAQSTTPLLAVRDSLHLSVEKAPLGYYRLHLESDTWPLGNDNFTFVVSDTVRADATIDRDVINLDVDHEINSNAWVNFGFPYIPVIKPSTETTTPHDTVPTVRFITTMKYCADPDLAISDTIAIVNEAFADNDIDLSRNMKLNLDGIQRDSLTSNYAPFVKVEITFNSSTVFEKSFPVTIVNTPSAVEEIAATLPEARRGIYNLMGVKMDVPFEQLPNGIYIVDGKKIAKR